MGRERDRTTYALVMVVLAVLIGALVAGCGSSSSSSESTTSSGGSSEAESSESGSSGGEAEESSGTSNAKLEALLAPYLERPTQIAQTKPLKEMPTGKTIAFLDCSAAPCKIINQGLESATKRLGANYTSIPSGGTPESFQAAAAQAVQEKPDALIMAGVNGSLIKKQVAELKAAGIKVIDWSTEENEESVFDAYYLSPEDYVALGNGAGAFLLENAGDEAHVLYMNFGLVGAVVQFGKGIQETVESECPNCTWEEIETTGEDWGSGAVNKVVSVLQQNPEWEYTIAPGVGAMSLGIPQAIKAAGLKATICCSQSGAPNTFADLKSGTQEMNMEIDLELLGYYAADAAARLLAGEEALKDEEIPWYQAIEGKDITFDPNTEIFHPLPNFEEEFEQVWSGK